MIRNFQKIWIEKKTCDYTQKNASERIDNRCHYIIFFFFLMRVWITFCEKCFFVGQKTDIVVIISYFLWKDPCQHLRFKEYHKDIENHISYWKTVNDIHREGGSNVCFFFVSKLAFCWKIWSFYQPRHEFEFISPQEP